MSDNERILCCFCTKSTVINLNAETKELFLDNFLTSGKNSTI